MEKAREQEEAVYRPPAAAAELFDRLSEAFFRRGESRLAVWLNRIWLAGLYLLGIVHWSYFLNWGSIPFDLHDWTQIGAYYDFLQQAVRRLQLPLHMGSPLVPIDRYLARPDTLLSPQAFLLWFLDIGPFTLANVLLLFSIGFLGLLLIQRRYALSPAAFSALFLLFSFNGHITAHLAVGHAVWTGYFLLPFFVYLVLRLVHADQAGWRWVLLASGVLFFIFLQGAFHFFLWCLIFLLGLAVCFPRYARPALQAIVFSVLASLVRILPPAVEYFRGGPAFISGFISATDLVSSLIVLKAPSEALAGPFNALAGWEVDTYIGLLGLAFLLYFAFYRTARRADPARVLFAPIFLLAFLSIGKIYYFITLIPLPLMDSERVPSRFLILPLSFLIVIGGIQLQRYLDERPHWSARASLFSLALLFLLGHDLFQHSRIWRVTNLYTLFPSTPVDLRSRVTNHPDPAYMAALAAGLAGSILTFVFLFYKARRERAQREE